MNSSRIKMRHLHCLVVVAQERSMLKAARLLALRSRRSQDHGRA